jgi:Phosphoenolpyruvate carboxylase
MVVPGWYGLGTGLRAARDVGLRPVLEEMREWAFFTNLPGNVEMTLAKTDLRIAECYVRALVEPGLQPLFDTIVREHDLTKREVLRQTLCRCGPATWSRCTTSNLVAGPPRGNGARLDLRLALLRIVNGIIWRGAQHG